MMIDRLAKSVSQVSNVWYRHKQPVKRLYQWPLIGIAGLYRRLLLRAVFVGVTGSLGKTQTKNLIGAVLRAAGATRFDPGTDNRTYDVAKNLLLTRHRDRYCLQEIGLDGPGSMAAPVGLFRPDIGVITNIRSDHGEDFDSRLDHVLEKARMIDGLPANGWAVLNADEPDLDTLRQQTAASIITYGFADGANVRADGLVNAPPRPIRFDVESDGERVTVESGLHGRHSAYAVLAALAVARVLKIPLDLAARAIEQAGVAPGRMQYVEHADGVAFLLDDFKASEGSLPAVVDFLHNCESVAGRTFLVLGTVTYSDDALATYLAFVEAVGAAADEILLVGALAGSLDSDSFPETVRFFSGVKDCAAYLNPRLSAGDLVVLKGGTRDDHLRRLEIGRRSPVNCWQMTCGRMLFCDECRYVEQALE